MDQFEHVNRQQTDLRRCLDFVEELGTPYSRSSTPWNMHGEVNPPACAGIRCDETAAMLSSSRSQIRKSASNARQFQHEAMISSPLYAIRKSPGSTRLDLDKVLTADMDRFHDNSAHNMQELSADIVASGDGERTGNSQNDRLLKSVRTPPIRGLAIMHPNTDSLQLSSNHSQGQSCKQGMRSTHMADKATHMVNERNVNTSHLNNEDSNYRHSKDISAADKHIFSANKGTGSQLSGSNAACKRKIMTGSGSHLDEKINVFAGENAVTRELLDEMTHSHMNKVNEKSGIDDYTHVRGDNSVFPGNLSNSEYVDMIKRQTLQDVLRMATQLSDNDRYHNSDFSLASQANFDTAPRHKTSLPKSRNIAYIEEVNGAYQLVDIYGCPINVGYDIKGPVKRDSTQSYGRNNSNNVYGSMFGPINSVSDNSFPRHNERKMPKKTRFPDRFDENEMSWPDWIRHFDTVARYNEWNDIDKADNMALSLQASVLS
jgi:hypothetical protein